MSVPESTTAPFQGRRKDRWRSIRWWAAAASIAVVALFALPFTEWSANPNQHSRIGLGLVTVFVICATVIRWQVRRHYRCPRCNQIPIRTVLGWRNEFGDDARDIEFNPEECPNCGATLR
jgi:ribosomal protein S27AE